MYKTAKWPKREKGERVRERAKGKGTKGSRGKRSHKMLPLQNPND